MDTAKMATISVMMLFAVNIHIAAGQAYQTRPLVPLGTTTADQIFQPQGGGAYTIAPISGTVPPTTTTRPKQQAADEDSPKPSPRPTKPKATTKKPPPPATQTTQPSTSPDRAIILVAVVTVGVVVIAIIAAVTVVLYKHKTNSSGTTNIELNAQAASLRKMNEGKPIKDTSTRHSNPNAYTKRPGHPDNESVYEVIVDSDTVDESNKESASKRSGPLPVRPTSLEYDKDCIDVGGKSTTPARNDDYYSYVEMDPRLRREVTERAEEEDNRISDTSYYG